MNLLKLNKLYRLCGRLILGLFIGLIGLSLNSCQSKNTEKELGAGAYYTCPMHPQVHSDHPGKCPICGMTLVKVNGHKEHQQELDSSLTYLAQPVNEVVVGQFKTITPQSVDYKDSIQLQGRIAFDERAIHTISTLVSGRVEKIWIQKNYQQVRKGQPVLALYSPELLKIQRNLIQAIQDGERSLKTELEKQLAYLGVSNNQIQQIVKSRKTLERVIIYSPSDGLALDPAMSDDAQSFIESASAEPLSVHEGVYVQSGQTLFKIQNTKTKWALLEVPDVNLQQVKVGDPIVISSEADPKNIVMGTINFIPVDRTGAQKTTTLRVYLETPWKIGTLVKGNIIRQETFSGLLVPASAVNQLGENSVVWVENPRQANVFQKRKVTIAAPSNDRIVVLSGLQTSDKIVRDASYMVDSETFTK